MTTRQLLRQHWLDAAERRMASAHQFALAGNHQQALIHLHAGHRALAVSKRYAPKAVA